MQELLGKIVLTIGTTPNITGITHRTTGRIVLTIGKTHQAIGIVIVSFVIMMEMLLGMQYLKITVALIILTWMVIVMATRIKKYISILIISVSISSFANDTVTILDENGDVQICKVTESGVIVCL
jgi:hypothetical protein